MSQTFFPNGVYGINLNQILEGPDTASLALLQEIIVRFNEVEHSSEETVESLYTEFKDRLANVLDKRGISLPADNEAFGIYPVDPSVDIDINEEEDFEQGDLILGIGILAFPNNINFPESFKDQANWHLWTLIG